MTRFTTLTVAAATALGLGSLCTAPAGASVLTPPMPVVQHAAVRDCVPGSAVLDSPKLRVGSQDCAEAAHLMLVKKTKRM